MRHVIIGNGIAGITAAEAIRHLEPNATITLLARETFPPYCRAMISMLVDGSSTEKEIILREEHVYDNLQIDAKIGQQAEGIDLNNRVVHTDQGGKIPFDRLLIATGADAVHLPVEGAELEGIFCMRTREDAENIAAAAEKAKSAAVIGGGLVGLKAAHALRQRGLKVTIVEKQPYLLPLIADEKAGRLMEKEARDMGVEVLTSASVRGFDGGGQLGSLVLEDGTQIECQMAVMAAGVRPSVGFINPEDLLIKRGVLVNEFLETSVEGIYAAGDVAEVMDAIRGEHGLTPIWPEAVAQGRIAGINMAGRRQRYEGAMRRNVIRFGKTDLLSGGIIRAEGHDSLRIIEWEEASRNIYRKYVFQDNRLVGAVLVNSIEQGGIVLSLIRSQRPLSIPEKVLDDPSFNFSKLLPRMG